MRGREYVYSFFSSPLRCRCSLFDQWLQLLEVWQSVCEPESHHKGGESSRRGNTEESCRRLDLTINGSGFRDAFSSSVKKNTADMK